MLNLLSIILLAAAVGMNIQRLRDDRPTKTFIVKAHAMTLLCITAIPMLLLAGAGQLAIYLVVVASWCATSLSAYLFNPVAVPQTVFAGR